MTATSWRELAARDREPSFAALTPNQLVRQPDRPALYHPSLRHLRAPPPLRIASSSSAPARTYEKRRRSTDTEFPGVVARPIGEFRSNADYQYQLLRCNVDLLKIIQLGLTFMNEQGEYPPGTSTWQFNFKFNLTEDMYAQDSIELLTTSGIQFKKHEEEGIETQYFAELLMTSGVVLCEGVKWLSFHSGYDFGYLIKILTNSNLPEEELDFFEILRLFFPVIYDVKYLMKSCKNLKGGLQEVAEQLELERIGPQHQAGSDSLLTGMAFFKMREMFFEDHIDDAKYCGHLYGLGSGSSYVQNGTGNAYEEEANKQS
ncbi:CCR4-NOT transcription complex subunit 7 [Pteropus alecto]|uniref:poly(A)-specific ribonuclease n=1 Tax=Pteropus alecto TaxID=9402 RepID=L5KBZ3_PTEAL|nr:CCR4-NOT transcription complex subunit 7 [Pteropus alecto]